MTAPRISDPVHRGKPPPATRPSCNGSAVLQKAASRAEGIWLRTSGDDLTAQEISELLAAFAKAVEDTGHGVIDRRLQSAAGRRLVELVRSEIVHVWSEANEVPPAREMLETLEAVESVRTVLAPDDTEQFASRLAGPDGLGLLVEVAHDLRSPLTSILFLADTLQRRLSGEINDLQHRQLGLIYSAALGLSEMASNVLELIKGGSSLAEDEPSPFSVRELFESVLDMVRPMAEEKGLIMKLNPPRGDHRMGHSLALSRVLLNLTTNALKFTEQGFVEIRAHEAGTHRVEFSVQDSGPGMNQTTLETLYSPFRPATGRAGLSNTGLGLALSRRLVQAMGSELHVESELGLGTRFYFQIDLPPVQSTIAITR